MENADTRDESGHGESYRLSRIRPRGNVPWASSENEERRKGEKV